MSLQDSSMSGSWQTGQCLFFISVRSGLRLISGSRGSSEVTLPHAVVIAEDDIEVVSQSFTVSVAGVKSKGLDVDSWGALKGGEQRVPVGSG